MTEAAKPQMLNEVGEFDVMMMDPYWEAPKEDTNAPDKVQMVLVIPCVTNDNRQAYYRFYFSNTLATKGRNAGKSMFAVNAEACLELGMASPFDPSRIHELDGKTAYLVMAEDTYNGKTTIKPKWLNPQRAKKLDAGEVKNVWAKLTGGKPIVSAAPAAAKPLPPPPSQSNAPDDQLPF